MNEVATGPGLRDVNEYLHSRWVDMMEDARQQMVPMQHIIQAFADVGLLSVDQAELWQRRIKECPGHEHDPCRVWCAYCGEIEPLAEGALRAIAQEEEAAAGERG